MDYFTKGCLAIEVYTLQPGRRVVSVLGRLAEMRGLPRSIIVDNGPELISKALDVLAYEKGLALRFIEPGKPQQNAYIESFNSKFRDECLTSIGFDRCVMRSQSLLIGEWNTTKRGRTSRSVNRRRRNLSNDF